MGTIARPDYLVAGSSGHAEFVPGGISDAGSISLALIDSTTVDIAFVKPVDADFASAILYRREVGGVFAAVHTYTDSGTWRDTGVAAETTYIYGAVAKNSDGVNGPPTRVPAIRTVTSATISGLYSIPVNAICILLANCPSVWTFLGVGNEADALLKIYPFIAGEVAEGKATSTSAGKLVDIGATFVTNGVLAGDAVRNPKDDTSAAVSAVDSETQLSLDANIFTSGEPYIVSVARPLIVVGLPEGYGHDVLAQSTILPTPGNELEICFEKAIDGGNEVAGKQADAWYGFGNELGAIVDEMLTLAGTDDGSHVYVSVAGAEITTGPGRPDRDEAVNVGNAYGATITVRLL